MAETTVSLGKGQRKGKYTVTPDQILAAAAKSALKYGLGEEGARVVQAILKTEGGLTGDVGDADGGGSYGPTQLYWGGQLANLAKDLGVSLKEAATWVQTHPIEAVDWSVKGYLGNAIQRGIKAGLEGPALATFAQKVGQVSVSPERAGQVYQSLFSSGGGLLGANVAEAAELDAPEGGEPVAQNRQAQAPQPTKGAEILQSIVNKKGKQPISVTPRDPEVDEVIGGTKTGQKVTNPSPTYRFLWDDGTYLDVKANQDPNGSGKEATSYEVVGGTALASVAREDKQIGGQVIGGNSPSEKSIVILKPDGSIEERPNPNYVPPKEPAKPNNKQVVTRNGKSFIYDPDTGSFTPASGLPDEVQKPTTHVTGNRAITVGPDGTITSNTVLDPEAQRLANEHAQLENKQLTQQTTPMALLAIQNHEQLIRELTDRVAKGEMGSVEANDYITRSQQYALAALQGATPFQLQKQREDNERQARQQGIDLINQRMSTGSSLASSLLSSATNLAQHSLFAPGQTSFNFDPLAYAKAFTDDLGGGPQVSELARSLLMGARPQGMA